MLSFSSAAVNATIIMPSPFGMFTREIMQADMFRARHYFQVLWSVVVLYSVFVMNHLIVTKGAAYNLFHNQAMLTSPKVWGHYKNVPLFGYVPAIGTTRHACRATSRAEVSATSLDLISSGKKIIATLLAFAGNIAGADAIWHFVTLERKTAYAGGKPSADGEDILAYFRGCLPTRTEIIA